MARVRIEALSGSAPRVQVAEVAGVLSTALMSDPGWGHVVPDEAARHDALRTLLAASVRAAGAGEVRVVRVDGQVAAAAVWPGPGSYPWRWRQRVGMVPALLGLGLRRVSTVRAVAAFGASVDAAFPAQAGQASQTPGRPGTPGSAQVSRPVRYLLVLGVAPQHQRRGLGAALLAEGLSRADAHGEVVYLETSAAANVGYYRRWGFQVLAGSPAPLVVGGPLMWRMQRAVPGGASPVAPPR